MRWPKPLVRVYDPKAVASVSPDHDNHTHTDHVVVLRTRGADHMDHRTQRVAVLRMLAGDHTLHTQMGEGGNDVGEDVAVAGSPQLVVANTVRSGSVGRSAGGVWGHSQ